VVLSCREINFTYILKISRFYVTAFKNGKPNDKHLSYQRRHSDMQCFLPKIQYLSNDLSYRGAVGGKKLSN
jgi:hypothetical protein